MGRNLTDSHLDRSNVLNNAMAMREIEKAVGLRGILFQGRYVFLKEQVASFLEIAPRTVERYLESHNEELVRNGYVVLRGEILQSLKKVLSQTDVPEIDVGNILRSPQLGVFDFRAFLNLAMLVVEGTRARLMRQMILDIVIDTINLRCGGSTKYINQRDEDFIFSLYQDEDYHRQFTDSLRDFVSGGNFKYANYTNKIYLAIFRERNQEYRKILRLAQKDRTRHTFYSEVLDLITAFESGLASELKKRSEALGRKLEPWEVDSVFDELAALPLWKPLIEKARMKMASRDLAFRDALHENISEYIRALPVEDFERFLGEKSKELAERIEDAQEVLKRLRDRG